MTASAVGGAEIFEKFGLTTVSSQDNNLFLEEGKKC